MIMRFALWHLVTLGALSLNVSAYGGYEATPEPISKQIANADIIVVAEIASYVPDVAPKPAPGVVVLNNVAGNDLDEVASEMSVRGSGTYLFKSIRSLKGEIGGNIEIHLPLVSSYYYDLIPFKVKDRDRVILLLRKEGKDALAPVAPLMPLIPISARAGSLSNSDLGDKKDAIDVLLESMADSELQFLTADILKDVKDMRTLRAFRALANDTNLRLRAAALNCLAVNQDIEAIPKIVSLAREMESRGLGSGPVDALSFYKNVEALPLLLPILSGGTDLARLNAMTAVKSSADMSSVPFLIEALDQDDSQKMVSYLAYATLHRLIGETLPPVQGRAYFLMHRDEEIRPLKQWWEWEQLKQKKAAASRPAYQPTISQPIGVPYQK